LTRAAIGLDCRGDGGREWAGEDGAPGEVDGAGEGAADAEAADEDAAADPGGEEDGIAVDDAAAEEAEGDEGPEAEAESAVDDGGPSEEGVGDDGVGDEGPGDDADGGPEGEGGPDLCADGFPRGAGTLAVSEVARFSPSPEGVTVCPGGDVFVSIYSGSTGEIRRVPADGSPPVLYATLPGHLPAGLACDDAGRIFVADFNGTAAGDGGCLRVDREGHEGLHLPNTVDGEALDNPNGIVFVPGAGVYLSDSQKGWVVRYVETGPDAYAATLVASGFTGVLTQPGANGLAWHAAPRRLYLAVSTMPRVVSWEVAADGTLVGSPVEAWSSGSIFDAADGVAVDAGGVVYVAQWLRGLVLRVSDGEFIATFPNPASFAFRGGTLFVTSYVAGATAEGSLQAIDVGVCGGAR
jgi:sugar lactone lactonase YvrE